MTRSLNQVPLISESLRERLKEEFNVKEKEDTSVAKGTLLLAVLVLGLSGATLLMPWVAPMVWTVAGIFVW